MLFEEFDKALELTQAELARRLGVSYPRLNEIIKRKRSITPDTALRLSCVSGKSKYHGAYRTLEAAKSEKKELVELIDTGKVLKIRKKDAAMMTFAEVSKAIRESWQRRFAN